MEQKTSPEQLNQHITEKFLQELINKAVVETATALAKTFVTTDEAAEISRDSIPKSLASLGSSPGSGSVLRLGTGGNAEWGDEVAGSGGLDLDDKVFFGYSISGAVVTIYASEIDGIATDETEITMSETDCFAYARRSVADDTMVIVAGESGLADTSEYKYYKLYQFTVTATEDVPPVTTVVLAKACRPFSIEGLPPIPAGAYSGSTYALMVNQVGGVPVIQWVETEEFACP